MRAALLLATVILSANGCSGGGDVRQEVVLKLRALGVAAQPLVSAWSPDSGTVNEVELTLYAALPLSQTAVSVAPYRDPRQTAPLTLAQDAIDLDQSTLTVTPVGGLNIISIKAHVKVPTAAQATALRGVKASTGGGEVFYGFKVDAGSEQELVTGSFMVRPTGSAELTESVPTVEIVEPASGAVLPKEGRGRLKATVNNVNSEEIKLGWFTSGGEIQNRRAKETAWTYPGAGPQTVILTIRGKKSRGFSFKMIPVTTE